MGRLNLGMRADFLFLLEGRSMLHPYEAPKDWANEDGCNETYILLGKVSNLNVNTGEAIHGKLSALSDQHSTISVKCLQSPISIR